MDQDSLIVSFDAAGLVMGDLTAQVPGLVVRQFVQVDGSVDDLQVAFEVINGGPHIERIRDGFTERYAATFNVLFDHPSHWKAMATVGDASSLERHPVYGPAFQTARLCHRAVIVFEAGMSIHRYDFDPTVDGTGRREAAERLRLSCEAHGLSCMIRFASSDTPIEEWRPLDDPTNHPGS